MLGYACINTSLGKSGSFRTTTVKSASKLSEQELLKKIKSITIDNLFNTYQILKWNIKNNIFMYRFSSDLIPLATHELNTWEWWNDEDVLNICNRIKIIIQENNIRVSMHPGQYTVLNSIKADVVQNAIKDLEYHNRLSNLIGNDTLILHVGGVSGDKHLAIQRFIDNFQLINKDIQSKIVLENDDKSFNAEDVLYICEKLNIRMCLDLHHHRCLESDTAIENLIDRIFSTWKNTKPKIHLSSGREYSKDKSHADYVTQEDLDWAIKIIGNQADIMFECKNKEQSIFKLKMA